MAKEVMFVRVDQKPINHGHTNLGHLLMLVYLRHILLHFSYIKISKYIDVAAWLPDDS